MVPYGRLEGVLRVVKRDHQRVVALLASLVTQADPILRWEIFDDLRRTLNAHARAERAAFYPLFDSDRLLPSALKADDEHSVIAAITDELAATRPFAASWYELSKQLREQVELHFASEEGALFEAAHTLLPATTLRRVGDQMLQVRRELAPDVTLLTGI